MKTFHRSQFEILLFFHMRTLPFIDKCSNFGDFKYNIKYITLIYRIETRLKRN